MLLAVALSTMCALPVFAVFDHAHTTHPDPNQRSIISEEQEKKEALAISKYNDLLIEWAVDSRFVHDIYTNFPYFFGGAYIDENKNLVINVTTHDEITIDYFSRIVNIENVVFNAVDYSMNELIAQKDLASESMFAFNQRSESSKVAGVGLCMRENSINLYIFTPSENNNAAQLAEQVRYEITSFKNTIIVHIDEMPTELSNGAPGTGIGTTSMHTRSIGYWATDRFGQLSLVTAAHLGFDYNLQVAIQTIPFGRVLHSHNRDDTDAAFVLRTNSSFQPIRRVQDWNFDLIRGATIFLPQGSGVYSRGMSSGARFGTVTDISATSHTGIRDTTRVDNTWGARLDSGGVVAGSGNSNERFLAGIIQSGRDGGGNYFFYTKAANINNRFSLSVW